MALRKSIPLILIASTLLCFFYFHLYRYFNFESLQAHRFLLLQWTDQYYSLAVLIYISIYCLAVAAAFPSVLFLSIAGGFLFGSFPGALYVLIGATLGSILLYFSVKLALSDWFETKAEKWIKPLEQGLRQNAFSYLLFLRLIPIFPFAIINIVAGLFNLPLSIFIIATFLGLIPGTVIYTSIGKNLNTLFELHQAPHFNVLLNPSFLLPLLALAALATLPLLFKYLKNRAK